MGIFCVRHALDNPFGAGATSDFEKAWALGTTRVSVSYSKRGAKLSASAKEGCKWCAMIADAILHHLELNDAYKLLNHEDEDELDIGDNGAYDESLTSTKGSDEMEDMVSLDQKESNHPSCSNLNEKESIPKGQTYLKQRRPFLDTEVSHSASGTQCVAYDIIDGISSCDVCLAYCLDQSERQLGYSILEIQVERSTPTVCRLHSMTYMEMERCTLFVRYMLPPVGILFPGHGKY